MAVLSFVVLLLCLLVTPSLVRNQLIPQSFCWGIALQLLLLGVAGLSILLLGLLDFSRKRDAESALLCLWVGGIYAFSCLVNWTVNVRSLLPMAPAVGVLISRQIECNDNQKDLGDQGWIWPLIAALSISLCISWADYSWANSAREAAEVIQDKSHGSSGHIWFKGHWGFQYYMEQMGARALIPGKSEFKHGDLLIIPENNTNVILPMTPIEWAKLQPLVELRPCRWLATMSAPLGAGFYTDKWGPLPFAIGPAPKERYVGFLITSSMK